MHAQAQVSVEYECRAVTGTPMDEMGPAERAELLDAWLETQALITLLGKLGVGATDLTIAR
jgi:hypothetical protein